jgi:hypothetical protein
MAAITDLSDVINVMTGGGAVAPELKHVYWDGRIDAAVAPAMVAGRGMSFWLMNNTNGRGAIPGAVAVPDNTTLGGLRQTDPTGGRQLWCMGGIFQTINFGSYMLYDRLLHIGGLNGTTLAAQAVGGTLTRNTGGVGNMIAVEIYTAIGGTATTAVVNYTNQAGNPAVSKSFTIGGAGLNEQGRFIIVPLADGDSGVRGVTDIDLLATTGTAGNFGVTVFRPLVRVQSSSSMVPMWWDALTMPPGPVEIPTDACLASVLFAGTTTALTYNSLDITFLEK